MAESDEPSQGFTERTAVLLVEVSLTRAPGPGWAPGPLPLEKAGVTADQGQRATYFDPGVCAALYGSKQRPFRWHRSYSTQAQHSDSSLLAAEILRMGPDGDQGILMVHLELPDSGRLPQSLFELTRLDHHRVGGGDPPRAWMNGLLEGAGSVAALAKRATSLVLVTSSQGEWPQLLPPDRYSGWSRAEQWLWVLASASPFDQYPPQAVDHQTVQTTRILISDDWDGLVLRDGSSFVGLQPDSGEPSLYFRKAALYVRTLYADALAVGVMQRLHLRRLADDMAELGDPLANPSDLSHFEVRLAQFRNVYWWKHLTGHGPANQLLSAYQAQHDLDQRLEQVVGELSDFSRQAQALASDKTNALLGVLTITGLPLTLAVGLLDVFGQDSKCVVWGVLGAILLASLLFVGLVTPHWARAVARAVRGKP